MASRVESQGGTNSVKLVVVSGDGPAPPPMADPSQPLPYLWVFLPRLGEQLTERDGRSDKKERHEKSERREKLSFATPQQDMFSSLAERPENETGRSRKEEKMRKGKSGEHRTRNGRQRRRSASCTRTRSCSKSRSCSRSRSRG